MVHGISLFKLRLYDIKKGSTFWVFLFFNLHYAKDDEDGYLVYWLLF